MRTRNATVILECQERFGPRPCIQIISSRGGYVEQYDCRDYCPLLKRVIKYDELEAEDVGDF